RLYEVPFSSGVKSMITLHKYDGREKFELFVKGAPEKLLRDIKQIYHNGVIKPIVRGEKDAIAERITALSKNGFRVLLAGFREVGAKDRARPLLELLEEGITFVCLYGLRDPLRFDVKDTLAKAKEAGIRVLMLTGDHKLTAQCIGIELGLIGKNEAVVEGDIFTKSDDRAREIILNTASVFARVAPEDKLALVSALRKRGWVVAMTGDGVNDAPA
ncbi:MAG TPA: ATPase, partial [Candidatus Jacksonbacteria bacterium]|nr:ATPase [Candidatus Jacksonbacteria bacterium]